MGALPDVAGVEFIGLLTMLSDDGNEEFTFEMASLGLEDSVLVLLTGVPKSNAPGWILSSKSSSCLELSFGTGTERYKRKMKEFQSLIRSNPQFY